MLVFEWKAHEKSSEEDTHEHAQHVPHLPSDQKQQRLLCFIIAQWVLIIAKPISTLCFQDHKSMFPLGFKNWGWQNAFRNSHELFKRNKSKEIPDTSQCPWPAMTTTFQISRNSLPVTSVIISIPIISGVGADQQKKLYGHIHVQSTTVLLR